MICHPCKKRREVLLDEPRPGKPQRPFHRKHDIGSYIADIDLEVEEQMRDRPLRKEGGKA